jgi:RNA polymerase sigma-70 factor (ECF subfamily)
VAADAEDLVQEAFLDAHRSLGQLQSPDNPLPWLVAILRRRWIKWLRSRKQVAEVGWPNGFEQVAAATHGASGQRAFDAEDLQAALDRLPSEFREVLVLFYFRDLKYRDIAEATETPLGTVMSRIARGKAALRRLLEGDSHNGRETRDGTP